MARKAKLRFSILRVFVLASLVGVSLPHPVEAANLQIQPPSIHIGMFFDGAQITLSDVIPRDCEAVVEVRGKVVEEDLMRKGRRWELWMNVGEIDIKGAPSFYMIASSVPQLLENPGSHSWGYHALGERVTFVGRRSEQEKSLLFREFIELKQGQGVYGRYPGALQTYPADEGEAAVHGTFHLPARIAPGTYQVCLSVIKNGKVMDCRCAPLEIERVGLPRFLVLLAGKHAVFYGFLCVATAMAFGFLSGVFFRKIRLRSQPKDEC